MEDITARKAPLDLPETVLSGELGSDLAAQIVSAAADIAIVVDAAGTVLDVAYCDPALIPITVSSWIGKPWSEAVTTESKPKITLLLKDAHGDGERKWRQLNHPMADAPDLPVRYVCVPLEKDGAALIIGREMQSVSHLQQDLVKTQQAMEREYTRLRHAETKYRALFQMTTEAVLVLDAGTYRVVDANPSAIRLLDLTAGQLIGRYLRDWVISEDQGPVTDLFSSVRRTGNQMAETVRFKSIGNEECTVSASLFRQGSNAHLLVRIEASDEAAANTLSSAAAIPAEVIARLPEAFVITDLNGRIELANPAFLELSQLPTLTAATGQEIGRWVGRSDYEVSTLITALLDDAGSTRVSTIVRGELGTVEDIEVCAVAIPDGKKPCIGFSIRSVEGRLAAGAPEGGTMPGPQSVEELANLIGRVSLKDIVREATDVIERMAIQAALKHTGNNRASASELLGLSRQSLYVKLHRYGIAEGGRKSDELDD